MDGEKKRECGECSACCFTHSVSTVEKSITKMFEWCEHCTQGAGCSIYKSRPPPCRAYKCLWLVSPAFKDEVRPDRWGIILDFWTIPGEERKLLNVWECIEGRFTAPDIQTLIKDWVETGRYVIAGRPMSKKQHMYFPEGMFESDKLRFVYSAIAALTAAETAAQTP